VDNNKKPWYIWLSIIALPFVLNDTWWRHFLLERWRKDPGKTKKMQSLYNRHISFLVLSTALPAGVLAFINEHIAGLLGIEGLDGWLNLPCIYFIGVNAAWQHVKWRRKHDYTDDEED
jgi:hypothetical protein